MYRNNPTAPQRGLAIMNTKQVLKFTSKLTSFLFVIVIIAGYPLYKLSLPVLQYALGESFLFFYLLSIGAFIVITWHGKKKSDILQRYMLSIGMRLAIGLLYFIIMLKSFKGFEIGFTISFFCGYLICTGFEVYYLLHNLREISDAPNNAD